jgi:hypothetical protein
MIKWVSARSPFSRAAAPYRPTATADGNRIRQSSRRIAAMKVRTTAMERPKAIHPTEKLAALELIS